MLEESLNKILKTLGDKLNRVEEVIETQDHIQTSFIKKDDKPLFKPFEFSKKFQENPYIDQFVQYFQNAVLWLEQH